MNISEKTEQRINELLSKMTIEEKVSLCHANSKFTSSGVERLGISELVMSDGPHGVRADFERDSWTCLNRAEDACTYLPTGTALAATWNIKLARRFGEVLGSEARYRGKDIILGPGINIIRTPLCGRNFEYMSEDPCLIAKTVPEIIKGIESKDVASCVKHYALNNQELDRGFVNSELSKRALHEIYLKGFKSAVVNGGASSVMGAYNRYKNQHCCHNEYLVNKILKGKWNFKGVFLSDWDGTHNTDEAIANGLDIEMGTNKPYSEYYLSDAFVDKATENADVRKALDDKVRRILRLMFSIKHNSPTRNKGEYNTKYHQQTAYDIAAEAMVLLKNDDKILPLNKNKLKKILVLGPNADVKHSKGGCSSGVDAFYEITPLKGIQNRLDRFCEIEYISGALECKYKDISIQYMDIADLSTGCRGCKITAYDDEKETIFISNTATVSDGAFNKAKVEFSVTAPETGIYSFRIATTGSAKVTVNNNEAINLHHGTEKIETVADCSFCFKQNDTISFSADVSKEFGRTLSFSVMWITPSDFNTSTSETEIIKKAQKADYVIYCGGLDHSFDTEACDKSSMLLPAEQDALIPKLLKANANTIISLVCGSPVSMPWIDDAKAVIWNWYSGMETGNVFADILIGDVCPSGKMPFTLPFEYSDTPVARYGEYRENNCKYNEDILVGYRGFEYDNITPMFPFGHGLSYAEFEYSDLNVKVKDKSAEVSLKVKNIGNVPAKETAQLYVGDNVCTVKRPVKELIDFKKAEVNPGETVKITLYITQEDLSFYDESTEDWMFENGEFTVYVGSSSKDIRLKCSFKI